LPQQETKSSTKQLAPTDPILGPENLLKTGFAQKDFPCSRQTIQKKGGGKGASKQEGQVWKGLEAVNSSGAS
jgi:hypothetical protein